MGFTGRRGRRGREALVRMLLALALMLGLAGPGLMGAAYAQVATTTVLDTVFHADGTAATGTVIVSWPAFSTMTGASVPGGNESVTIGPGGVLSLALAPNVGATPIGSYYTVVYHLDDGTVQREFWVIPVSQAPVKLSAVKSTVVPTSVAMQTVSKSYVDSSIAAALTGHPLDTTPYVLKSGDTMTGPLVLPGDPVSANQAADKNYVDTVAAGGAGGLSQKVALTPATTQTVVQPAGTDLEVNRLNGVEASNLYSTQGQANGIGNALNAPDCTAATGAGLGCMIAVPPTVNGAEQVFPTTYPNQTHVQDLRLGAQHDSYFNPRNAASNGNLVGQEIDVTSTDSTQQVHQATGVGNVQSAGLIVSHDGLTGGSNLFPENLESPPYFKTNYVALAVNGSYNTLGQHVLNPLQTYCYAVGDCLIGSQFIHSFGGARDSADEGAHPYDIQITEDPRVFTGLCSTGCTAGSQVVMVGSQSSAGTQGEGRYLIDKNPAKVITQGQLIGGSPVGIHASATFSGTSFPVSTFFATGTVVLSQANDIAPGTVTIPIATSGVPAGYSTNTAAAPGSSGVACVADRIAGSSPQDWEMGTYSIVDGTHLQMTLLKPHAALATIAIGGLCGYGVEQTIDTANGIRQVMPVIGSTSPSSLIYAGGFTSILGQSGQASGYQNLSLNIVSAVRTNNLVTLTVAGSLPSDVNGLTLTIAGVTDSSYNGSFPVTTTSNSTLTYAEAGANSTSSGGTASILTGGYALYPMAEVLSVYNPATKGVDGKMTLGPNTVAWAANDPVEEPHYFQITVGGDTTIIGQTQPRPSQYQSAGYLYGGNNGPGLRGFQVQNGTPASSYLGNGGTHGYPDVSILSAGIWNRTFEAQAGETSLMWVHCNSKGCNKWNSGYNLFELDNPGGRDTLAYQPNLGTMTLNLRGIGYTFAPQAFTAQNINVTNLTAGSIHMASGSSTLDTGALTATSIASSGTLSGAMDAGSLVSGTIAAGRLPVDGRLGTGHAAGAVPDPGATAGTTRYLREDGTWFVPPGGGGGGGGVPSFNGRTGAIVPATGDYSFGQIAGGVSAAQMPGLTGDVSAVAGSTATTLATVNSTTGTFGSSGTVPVITVDGKGRVTSASSAAIAGPGGLLAVPSSLNTGLLADYNFYQQGGTVLTDLSGNGNNGVLGSGTPGAPTWTPTGMAFLPGQGVSLPAALNGAKSFVAEVYLTPLTAGNQISNGYPLVISSSMGGGGTNLLTDYDSSSSTYGQYQANALSIYSGGHKSSSPNLFSGYHVLTYTLGTGSGDLDRLYIDGVETGTYITQTTSAGAQTSGNLYVGSSGVNPWGNSGLNGIFYRLRVYSTKLAPADVQTLTTAMNGEVALRGVATQPVPLNLGTAQLHCVGDSITAGLGAATPFCAQLALTNQPAYTISNWGIIGVTMQSISASEANRVALRCRSSFGPTVASVFAGTNDFGFFLTPQKVFGYLMSEVQVLKQAGCRVFVGTMISRTGNDVLGSTYDADKDVYDGLILSQARAGGADGIVDFAASPVLGADGANAGATYFQSDHVHPTTAGQAILAAEMSNALNYYFGATEGSPKVVTALPYAMAAGDGYVSLSGLTSAGALTLPDCTGQSGAVYRVNNPQSTYAVSVGALNGTQPINGLTNAVVVPANGTLTLRDTPNAKAVGGCHWEM